MTLVEDLARLVGFDTVSRNANAPLADWVAERCADLGFEVERHADDAHPGKCTLVARIGPRTDDRGGLVLSGHMDVVPTEDQPWTSDPFVLTARDGKLYGRGTADMKGFFAVTLHALAQIARREYRRELALVWTHDEEVGCLGSAKLARSWAPRDPLPIACLIGEPTGFEILRMHPGHVAAEVSFVGKAAHSSRPDLGINAVEAACDAVGALRRVAAEFAAAPADLPEMERPWVVFNAARIQGGTAVNIVPDRCTLHLGYRPLPGMDPAWPFERLRAEIAATAPVAAWEGHIQRITPAMLTRAGTDLEGLLRPHAHGPGCGSATFATDGGNLAKLGLEPLVFGPGHIEVAHQADEWVAEADLHRAVGVIASVVRARCC